MVAAVGAVSVIVSVGTRGRTATVAGNGICGGGGHGPVEILSGLKLIA